MSDDLDPVSVSGFGRLSWVGGDGGLTGSPTLHICFAFCDGGGDGDREQGGVNKVDGWVAA